MSKFTREQIRDRLIKRQFLVVPFPCELPGLEDLKDEMAVMEMDGKIAEEIDEMGKDSKGETNYSFQIAGYVVKCLVTLDRDRVFEDRELALVAGFGLSVNLPISQMVKQISGSTDEQREQMREALKKIRAGSPTAKSTETSVDSAAG